MERIIGTEVEYGISVPGDKSANPILTSTQAVLAYAAAANVPRREKRTRWDYEVESPMRDARGYDLGRHRGPAPIIDADEIGAANMILTNGARLYVDHAHPEYSAPEVRDPLDAVIWDKAGERVMEEAARYVASVPGAPKLQLYKNNIDGKGASYGTHENYLCQRETPFEAIVAGLMPFFASRQVICGSGRVGIGQHGEEDGYQLSQRADYIEVEVGLETTLKRGIINTRDEPHAEPDKYRRLHVIIGDANLAETATYLKVGTTSLVLDLIEAGVDLSDLTLAWPVNAVHEISHDPSLTTAVALADGRELTGLALQREYLARVRDHHDRTGNDDPRAAHAEPDKYRRLHVIIGDANLAETATYLKVGTTSLVLDLIEAGVDLSDLALAWPVNAVHEISHDPSLTTAVALADGRELTGLALQREYLARVRDHHDRTGNDDPRAAHVIGTWADVLDKLERDPMECAEILDWPAKLRLLEGFRRREGLSWGASRLKLIDLQYSDVRLDKGLYNRLVARGSMTRLVTEDQVQWAVANPPPDTRAYFRGTCVSRFGADVAAASWDSVIFDLGEDTLIRIPTMEPLRGTKQMVGDLLESADSAADVVAGLKA